MNIAGIEIEDENVISVTFNGVSPEQIKNVSLNGKGRSCVTLKVVYSYTIELVSIDKKKYTELFKALLEKSIMNELISIDMHSLLRAEIPQDNILDGDTAIDFEFDISQMKPINRGGYFDITLPVRYVQY